MPPRPQAHFHQEFTVDQRATVKGLLRLAFAVRRTRAKDRCAGGLLETKTALRTLDHAGSLSYSGAEAVSERPLQQVAGTRIRVQSSTKAPLRIMMMRRCPQATWIYCCLSCSRRRPRGRAFENNPSPAASAPASCWATVSLLRGERRCSPWEPWEGAISAACISAILPGTGRHGPNAIPASPWRQKFP